MRQLKMLLRSRKKTQSWLAEQLGVHYVTVSNWARGAQSPDMLTIQRIANLLQCDPDEITGGSPLMTDQERRHLAEYRALPSDSRLIIEQMTHALLAKSVDSTQETSLTTSTKKPY